MGYTLYVLCMYVCIMYIAVYARMFGPKKRRNYFIRREHQRTRMAHVHTYTVLLAKHLLLHSFIEVISQLPFSNVRVSNNSCLLLCAQAATSFMCVCDRRTYVYIRVPTRTYMFRTQYIQPGYLLCKIRVFTYFLKLNCQRNVRTYAVQRNTGTFW